VLNYTQKALAGKSVETVELDVEKVGSLEGLGRKWDYVVANALLEHLASDAAFVSRLRGLLSDDGFVVATTVLGPRLYNRWDHAVGHYRRYEVGELRGLFSEYTRVQILQTSILQEMARPLFFHRVKHLQDSTIEENNRRFGREHLTLGRPPYASAFWLLRWLLPVYAAIDWTFRDVQGGIAIVIARK
jgi:hypothetical protein